MVCMSTARFSQYQFMISQAANSPLLMAQGKHFDQNDYYFKCEYALPHGASHYARIFLQLMFWKEMHGVIQPGDILLETTSGSGGRAAAEIATALGYTIHIGIPDGGEKTRVQAIENAGGIVHLTPAELYVAGFPEFVKGFLAENPGVSYLNHMMGNLDGRGKDVNWTSIAAMSPIVFEIKAAFDQQGVTPDYVILPMGNGTSALGIAPLIKQIYPAIKVFGVESLSSAYAYRKKHPGVYESKYGISPERFPRHNLPGTTPSQVNFPLPALDAAIPFLDEIFLVSDEKIEGAYLEMNGTDTLMEVIRWDKVESLKWNKYGEFGRTGIACYAVAKWLTKVLPIGSYLIPVMDGSKHYDSILPKA